MNQKMKIIILDNVVNVTEGSGGNKIEETGKRTRPSE